MNLIVRAYPEGAMQFCLSCSLTSKKILSFQYVIAGEESVIMSSAPHLQGLLSSSTSRFLLCSHVLFKLGHVSQMTLWKNTHLESIAKHNISSEITSCVFKSLDGFVREGRGVVGTTEEIDAV